MPVNEFERNFILCWNAGSRWNIACVLSNDVISADMYKHLNILCTYLLLSLICARQIFSETVAVMDFFLQN